MEGQDLFFEQGMPLRVKVQSVDFNAVPTLSQQQEQVRCKAPCMRGRASNTHMCAVCDS